jgi:hypothetical protein
MASHTFVVGLDEHLSRRVRAFLNATPAYKTLDELVAIALTSQLSLEESHGSASVSSGQANASTLRSFADRSVSETPFFSHEPDDLLDTVACEDTPLSVFTNRLSPLKIAVRVLAEFRLSGNWPKLALFQNRAAEEARQVGLRLRRRDDPDLRRWIAYPVGEDAAKATTRFIRSFTLFERGSLSVGPLATLGLAGVRNGNAVLSRSGWALALAPSPILDTSGAEALGTDERNLFWSGMMKSHAEAKAIDSFIGAVRLSGMTLGSLDRHLQESQPDASAQQITALRAAQIGRLSDCGILLVKGRGPEATISLNEPADPGLSA